MVVSSYYQIHTFYIGSKIKGRILYSMVISLTYTAMDRDYYHVRILFSPYSCHKRVSHRVSGYKFDPFP